MTNRLFDPLVSSVRKEAVKQSLLDNSDVHLILLHKDIKKMPSNYLSFANSEASLSGIWSIVWSRNLHKCFM